MNLYDESWQVADLIETNKAVFLKMEPETPDFTAPAPFRLILCGTKQRVVINVDQHNIVHVIALLDATVFDKEMVDRLYVWNLKSLASYFHFFSQKFFTPTTSIIDLKIIESFLNIRKNCPENFVETIDRVKAVVKHKGWQSLYKSIHLPLALRVLPTIETTPLLNTEARRTEHPYYEIEGQINGRMNCLRKFAKSYLPHNMGPDVRKVLKPRGYGLRFLCPDFRHCEVTVLQWLSGDEKLKEILDSGADLHEKIYEIVTGDQCNTENKRKLSKKLFLPVMYGCGPSGLASALGLPDKVCAELIDRIKHCFPTAWGWMQSKQDEAKSGVILDYFARPRLFNTNEAYLARNFSVQGVAATICQEKLIELQKQLDNENAWLAFSVHDGFGLICKVDAARATYKLVKQVCEAESQLCPGLRMKIEIKFGSNLGEMKVLWKD